MSGIYESDAERRIVELFMTNVYGKKSDTSSSNIKHDGKKGHWLETQMGVVHNRNTAPDLLGFEMKDGTESKISFGDWSADYYIFNDPKYFPMGEKLKKIARREKYFLPIFGKPNEEKGGRFSWSGEPIPKIKHTNSFGTTLLVDDDDNIIIKYYFSLDSRADKMEIVPENIQVDGLTIVTWSANVMRTKVNDKFNQKGWFICKKDKSGIYNQIVFGNPIPFEAWISMVRAGDIYFDSGMYQGNSRPYSQWRANNATLDNLVVRRYPTPKLSG